MISISACNHILNVLGATPSFSQCREHEDMKGLAEQPTQGRWGLFVARITFRSALARRAERKALDAAIERLGSLSLHLLADIGIEEEQPRPRSATPHQTAVADPVSLPRAKDEFPEQRHPIAAE